MDANVRRLSARAAEQWQSAIHQTAPLTQLVFRPGRPDDEAAAGQPWITAGEGTRWGGEAAWATFKATFAVPSGWSGSPARLFLPLGGQGMAYLDGAPWQGLDGNHREITLPEAVRDGREHEVLVEEYAIDANTAPRRPGTVCEVGACTLRMIDAEAEALAYDLQVGAQTLRVTPEQHPAHAPLLEALLAAERLVDRRRPGSQAFQDSVREARASLARTLPELAAARADRARVLAMGHAHIDTAWLWPLAQTRRKVVRSWSTVLRLMEQYPEYHFLGSQAQQYQWIEQDEPALYKQIVQRVREGRWEPAAAMWVEPDVNLTSGESMVRQLLFGQRDSQARFGRQTGILWLPDTFGYSGALPQLMRGAGVHTIVTSKLSWNGTNRMPHDTFRWRGLDGSEVLAFFITAGVDAGAESWITDPTDPLRGMATYNGHVTPYEVSDAWRRYRDKQLSDTVLYPFGWGDGGGGPTAEMLETGRRLASYPTMPAFEQGPADPFLRDLAQRLLADPRTSVWDGEMYLEFHRGVYTSQAGVKAGNRRAEHDLHDAELWTAWAAARGADAAPWQRGLTEAWELVLLNQFHDILPGSSIGEVYVDQARQHARVREIAGEVRGEAQSALLAPRQSDGSTLALCSSLPWDRTDVALPAAVLAGRGPVDESGAALPMQAVTNLDGSAQVLIGNVTVPALGYQLLRLASADPTPAGTPLSIAEHRLENRFFVLELDDAGRIASLFDKTARRQVLLPEGGGNRLLAFEDKPYNFDAWEIDPYYEDKCWEIEAVARLAVVEQGPIRGGLQIDRQWDDSTISQRILIYADQPRIDFQTHVDWHHHQVLLKAAFPLNVRAANARYECAFGWVERPTHRNTSWDEARFEVAGHRWADLSEAGYGVSLLNDSKYGYDCRDGTLRLTLLKSGINPDPDADQGTHDFVYSLLPHGSDWSIADTVKAAYALNLPLTALSAGGTDQPVRQSLLRATSPQAVIDTVKVAEDGQGLIVRVYDCAGGQTNVQLVAAYPIREAQAVSILEQPDAGVAAPEVQGHSLTFHLPAFGVRSFRLHFA